MTTSEGEALSPTTGHASGQASNGAPPHGGRYNSADYGWTLAMELLTATFVWGGVGWLADRWLGTRPILMVIGFLLGNGLGIYLIWLRSNDRFVQEHAELMAGRGGSGQRAHAAEPSAQRPSSAPLARPPSKGLERDTARPVPGRPDVAKAPAPDEAHG